MDDFATWLDNMLRDHRLSQTEFAKRLGVSQALVSKVLSGKKKPSADFCLKVASVLGLSPVLVLQKAELVSVSGSENSEVTREITELAKNLPEDKQRQVLEFIKFLGRKGE